MDITFTPAKLLICLVGRHRGELLVSIAKNAGARGGTLGLGRTVGNNPILRALSLADMQQDIAIFLLGPEKDAVLQAIQQAAKGPAKKLAGWAILLDVTRMMTRQAGLMQDEHNQDMENKSMHSDYELITIITNSGFADDVMAAARKAGATGGTISTARGTGTQEDVKFFGISLVPEKDMLMIVATRDKVQDIIRAVNQIPKLTEPGGGIVFTQNIENFWMIGQ